jgi:ferredoxin--NADP+ reductase
VAPAEPQEIAITALLTSRNVNYTTLDGWHNLDQHELALGAAVERIRIKVVDRDEMVSVSNRPA